jgi:hypothetical protein
MKLLFPANILNRFCISTGSFGLGEIVVAQIRDTPAGSAESGSSAKQGEQIGTFVLNGEYWTIGFGGTTFSLRNILGLTHIRHLLQYPGEEFHALDLLMGVGSGTASGTEKSDVASLRNDDDFIAGRPGDAGPIIDAKAKQDYRRRILELQEELAELRECGDHQRGTRVESEIEALTRELAHAVGLGGRDRRAGSTAERARLNVTRTIRTAAKRISEHHAALGQLLESCIKTGSFCSYIPNPRVPIAWKFTLENGEPLPTTGTAPLVPLSRDTGLIELPAYRTTFVGREDECTVLRRCLAQAQNGEGCVVIVEGPPGIGKTRTSREIGEEARRQGFVVLAGNCYDREDSVPFVPFVELIEVALARAPSPAAVQEMLGEQAAELTRLLPQLRRLLPDLPAPLPLSAEQSRRLLFNAVVELIARRSQLRPLLLLLEDLHWADEGTLALLVHLGRSIARLPVLIIATHRNDDIDMKQPLTKALDELTRLRVVERIQLRGLPQGAVAKMIENISGRAPAPALVDLICSNTDGNPLFVEELIGHLGPSPSNHDLLERGEQVELDLPHSLRLVIGRRLGLVSRETARILDMAAVIGRSFPFALLEAATHSDPDQLLDSVEEAEKAGLISSKLEYPEARFQFAHELIRRAVLNEISIARRQRLHLNIAEALELLHPNDLEAHAEDLAYHFWYAGAAAEPARAIRYLQMAGEKAERSSAFKEAQQSYEQALALLSLLPDSAERDLHELDLRQSIFRMHNITTGASSMPESVDARARAIALAKKSYNLSQLASLMQASGFSALNAGDYKTAATLADQALELALREGNHTNLGPVYQLQVLVRHFRGDLTGVEEHFACGLKFFEDAAVWPLPVLRLDPFAAASWNAWALGRADLARARLARLLAEANENNPVEEAHSKWLAAVSYLLSREHERAEMLAARALELLEKRQMPFFAEHARCVLGSARAWLGRPSEGVTLIRQGIAGLAAIGAHNDGFTGALAGAQALSGAIGDALQTIEQVLQPNRPDANIWRPQAFRLRGELQTKQGRRDAAEADFRTALTLVRSMGAKALELRTATSLARLLRDTGRRDEARTTLTEIYNWFTEGFDTADLKDAKALLDELAT